jgi:hypothetical protein
MNIIIIILLLLLLLLLLVVIRPGPCSLSESVANERDVTVSSSCNVFPAGS